MTVPTHNEGSFASLAAGTVMTIERLVANCHRVHVERVFSVLLVRRLDPAVILVVIDVLREIGVQLRQRDGEILIAEDTPTRNVPSVPRPVIHHGTTVSQLQRPVVPQQVPLNSPACTHGMT